MRRCAHAVRLFFGDVGNGLWMVTQRSAVTTCLVALGVTFYVYGQPDLRLGLESQAMTWLKDRQNARATVFEDPNAASLAALKAALAEPTAIERATASDPAELDRQQAAVAWWLSRRYRVAPEPVSRLVQEAWSVGAKSHLDPTLILAVMAVESGFNPFAQSQVGAQGLMQVMTRIHDDKYQAFGGDHAAFDPVSNLRVGAQVLRECIVRAGSLEGGLKFYVGAANLADDGGYAAKVLAEQHNLRQVANGHQVPVYASLSTTLVQASTPTPAPASTGPVHPTGDAAPPATAAPQQLSLLPAPGALAVTLQPTNASATAPRNQLASNAPTM